MRPSSGHSSTRLSETGSTSSVASVAELIGLKDVADEGVIQVVLHPSMRAPFEEWLATRNAKLMGALPRRW